MVCCKDHVPIEIVRGTTNTYVIELVNEEDGSPYELSEGQSLIFGIKMNELDENTVFSKKITHMTDDGYYLEIEPSDTENLDPGQYYYDVGLKQGDNVFYNVIKPSPFVVLPNITKRGDVE